MARLRRIAAGIHALVTRNRADADLNEELQAYLATAIDEKRRAGMSLEAATRAARAEMGSLPAIKDHTRDAGWERSLETFWHDTRDACRSLRRHRGFTAVAVLTLALGIGANTAMFSVVNAVLLAPLPYAEPDRLVRLVAHLLAEESPTRAPLRMTVGLSVAELDDVRLRARTISQAGLSTIVFATWIGEDRTVRVEGARVSPALFDMLGVRAVVGRTFTTAAEQPGADDQIVLSYQMWQRHFGRDADVVGRPITLEPAGLGNAFTGPTSRTYSVVGVMPDGFDFNGAAQFWIPFAATTGAERPPRGTPIARLAPGVAPEAAATELGTMVRAMRGHSVRVRYEVVREHDEMVSSVRAPLLVLMAAVGFVLLIASVNVATLTLARTASRHHEIAIRGALGAGRGRVVRHLLTESLVLALLGGTLGILLAFGGIRVLQTLAATLSRIDVGVETPFPRLGALAIDGQVLGFTLLVSIATGVLFGLAAAIRYSKSLPGALLNDRTAGSGGGSARRRTQTVLMVCEVAMAVTLLIGAGLLMHSFARLTSVRSGYDPRNVLTFQLAMPQRPVAELARLSERLVERLRSVSDIEAATYARQLPTVQLQENASFRRSPAVPAQPDPPGADARLVGGDYFETLDIQVLAGRGLTEADRAGQPRVVVINETLARREFPGEQPVGQHVYIGRDSLPWQVVGVVEDVRQFGPAREPGPQFFADIRQWPVVNEAFIGFLGPYYAVRTKSEPRGAVAAVEQVVREVQPHATLHNVATMEELVANTVARPRLYSVLLGIFASIAAVLAAIGVYGLVAYAVGQRTREVGIRLALGAKPADVLRLVLRQTAALACVGIVAGMAGAAALTRYLEGMLFGVTALDAVTFVGVVAMFGVLASIAAYVPARRAMRIAPIVALQSE